jgi:hypothetical protein
MTNRARSTIILPILTYPAPVWNNRQEFLLRELRTAQNVAVRHMAGALCTTSVDPRLQLMAIMPIDISLKMLIKNASIRLYRLPSICNSLPELPARVDLPEAV